MPKITFQQFQKIMAHDVMAQSTCIEILFHIDEDTEYTSCWMGKLPSRDKDRHAVYWYGLVPDGSQAYDFKTAEDFMAAAVFRGNSLTDIWGRVTIDQIDGCSIEYRLSYYLEKN